MPNEDCAHTVSHRRLGNDPRDVGSNLVEAAMSGPNLQRVCLNSHGSLPVLQPNDGVVARYSIDA